MSFTARVRNARGEHQVEVSSGSHSTSIQIAPKASGLGSGVNGGELLMLALATCYCNDLYREAGKMGIEVISVDIECSADFPSEGASARNITVAAKISAKASEEKIRELAVVTDKRAEIQNTVRAAVPVRLSQVEADPV